jgi:hypothetical protein
VQGKQGRDGKSEVRKDRTRDRSPP